MNKEQIMDYLYGELDDATRAKFDQEIQSNPALSKEITELQQIRLFLQQSEDVEPVKKRIQMPKRRTQFMRRWWSIAAALLMLLVAGRLLGMQMRLDDRQLVISYGTPRHIESAITSESLKHLANSLDDLQNKVDQMPDATAIGSIVSSNSSPSDEDKAEWISAGTKVLRQKHDQLALQLTEQLQLRQQAYMKDVFTDLIQYWDTQRAEDLQLINASLDNFVQTIQLSGSELASFQSQENL